MKSQDTTPEAEAVQDEIFDKMSDAERLMAVFRLNDAVRSITRARIRLEQPQLSEQEATLELIYEYYGRRFKVIDGVVTEC